MHFPLCVHGYSHAPGACQHSKPDKLTRPNVSKKSTSGGWEYFITRWDAYKRATRIVYHDATLHLLECFEDSLRQDLHSSHSNIAAATEIDALAAIQNLAVKAKNAIVSRMTLMAITQNREEVVRRFDPRFQGQAKVWRFSKNGSHNPFEAVNYGDDIVRDALIRGLADNDIQQDVLGYYDQDMTLEDTNKFIEVKKAGIRSRATLQNPSGATVSSYKQSDKDQHAPLHGSRSENTPYATTINKVSRRRSKTISNSKRRRSKTISKIEDEFQKTRRRVNQCKNQSVIPSPLRALMTLSLSPVGPPRRNLVSFVGY